MTTVMLPTARPWVRVGLYYPGVEYQIEDDNDAQRLVDVKGFIIVEPEEEE